ncbi:hypothetical protein [Oceanicoccus sp. KOV_DT_Chl]|uniref:hypothetical protein n=1 Tax=Oceanicoccus sp. KOV_DT_Chl TaxID=1904639 RepID=UPI000C7A19DB|nr:hypothetical protein [Oceanicoccus sp. KOV_DT_Chl]
MHADAKTFQRKVKQTIAIREAFEVRSRSTKDDIPNHTVSLFARNADIDGANTSVMATLLLPDGSNQQVSLEASADRRWQLLIEGVGQSGLYIVSFEISGRYKDGTAFKVNTNPLEIEHEVLGSEIIRPVPVVPVSPPPEAENTPAKPQPESEVTPEPAEPVVEAAVEPTQEEGINWGQILLYAGIGLGNLLVLALGYFAYKAVASSPSESAILEGPDDIEVDEDEDEDEDDIEEDDEVSEGALDDLDEEPAVAAAAVTPAVEDAAEAESDEMDTEAIDDLEDELLDVGEVDVEDIDIDIDDVAVEDEEELEAEPMDDLDDILDLPDDAIDIDPASDDK